MGFEIWPMFNAIFSGPVAGIVLFFVGGMIGFGVGKEYSKF